jgi:hypothetical protein
MGSAQIGKGTVGPNPPRRIHDPNQAQFKITLRMTFEMIHAELSDSGFDSDTSTSPCRIKATLRHTRDGSVRRKTKRYLPVPARAAVTSSAEASQESPVATPPSAIAML